jgi:hypothetical protein
MSPALDSLSLELRSVVLGGDHVLAGRLVAEYATAVREFWESLPESERAASIVPTQARELLTWARGMAVVQRAMAAEHLAIVRKAGRYEPLREPGSGVARSF